MLNSHCSGRKTRRSSLPRLEMFEDRILPAASLLNPVAELLHVDPVVAVMRDLDHQLDSSVDSLTHDGASMKDGDVLELGRAYGPTQKKESETAETKPVTSDNDESAVGKVVTAVPVPLVTAVKASVSVPLVTKAVSPAPVAVFVGPVSTHSTGPSEAMAVFEASTVAHKDMDANGSTKAEKNTSKDNADHTADTSMRARLLERDENMEDRLARHSLTERMDIADAVASTAPETSGSIADSRTPWSRSWENDTDLNVALDAITDVNVSIPDDGSLGFNAPASLLTGSRLLPQQGSDVASVATLLGDGTVPDGSASGTNDASLNHLLVMPSSTMSSEGTETMSASNPTDQGTEGATPESENRTSLTTRLGSLILLPMLGWGIVQVRRLRQRKEELLERFR